jgi:transcriptional pleiotropic repressor
VTRIGSSAFSGCGSLTSIEIPDSLMSIGTLAFSNCPKLKLTVSAGNSSFIAIDSVLYNKNATQLVYVPDYITELHIPKTVTVFSLKENVNLQTLGFSQTVAEGYQAVITPVEIAGERLGTLFLYKNSGTYGIEDIILCEYGATVVGLEMLRSVSEESAEEIRKEQVLRSALSSLSYSELEAIFYVFDEMEESECVLIASKIADRVGITRSVIVNALRKLEGAGVIESRSSGMRGTYIKVVNELIFDELAMLRKRKGK